MITIRIEKYILDTEVENGKCYEDDWVEIQLTNLRWYPEAKIIKILDYLISIEWYSKEHKKDIITHIKLEDIKLIALI